MGNILKWEGIVIDPVGAALSVLVFEYILLGQALTPGAVFFFLKSIFTGGLIGLGRGVDHPDVAAQILGPRLSPRDQHADDGHYHLYLVQFNPPESGLFAVIAMGVVLANQREVEVQHIVSFKENLGILIISTLFIILGARLDFRDFHILRWNYLAFILVLVFFIRPLSVFPFHGQKRPGHKRADIHRLDGAAGDRGGRDCFHFYL